jgi:hypothetical protein
MWMYGILRFGVVHTSMLATPEIAHRQLGDLNFLAIPLHGSYSSAIVKALQDKINACLVTHQEGNFDPHPLLLLSFLCHPHFRGPVGLSIPVKSHKISTLSHC